MALVYHIAPRAARASRRARCCHGGASGDVTSKRRRAPPAAAPGHRRAISGYRLWDAESAVVQIENIKNSASVTLGPVDVAFTSIRGGARVPLVL
jgi:hypothetical protein